MENSGIMPVMDIANHGYGYGDGFGGGWFMWILVLFVLMGGNGWNNRGDVASTRDVYASNDFQSLRTAVNNLGNGIADATFALNNTINNGHNALARDIANGTYVIDKAITDNRYVLGNAINENRFAAQQGFNGVDRNIDAVRYENSMNTNVIAKAIADDGEKTRALIVANQMQDLRDKLADRDRDLQTAQYALMTRESAAQTINAVRPFPVPAFQVGNPYGNCSCNCGVTYGCQ